MTCKKWDIILVSFPFTYLKSIKKRPALVVSPSEYNRNGDVIVAFITSKMDRAYIKGDYRIDKWATAGLPKPSMIRMKFATIHNSIIAKKIGQLSAADVDLFKRELVEFFSG